MSLSKNRFFPFVKFFGADTVLGPEMRSTGEVMGIDRSLGGAILRAQDATGSRLPLEGNVFISVKDEDKPEALKIAKSLSEQGFEIIATSGTAKFFSDSGIQAKPINKVREGSPHVVDAILNGEVAMVINTPEGSGPLLDSRTIRSTAVQQSVLLFTTMAAAEAGVQGIARAKSGEQLAVTSLQEYLASLSYLQ